MIYRLGKETGAIAVALTPSCYCSGRADEGERRWVPALLLMLLNGENRTCSFLLRSGEKLSSSPPLLLKSVVLGE